MAGDPTAKFTVELEDQVSGAANNAASALTALQDKINGDVKALSQMRKAMRNLKGSASTSVEDLKKLSEQIDAQKAKIAAGQSKFLEMGGTFGMTAQSASKAGDAFGDMTGALEGAGGPLGTLGGSMKKLGAAMKSPIVLIGAMVAGFVALTAAIGAAAIAVAKFGAASADARREEALHIEGLNVIRKFWGMATASAEAYQHALDNVAQVSNASRQDLMGTMRVFTRLGMNGADLSKSMETVGMAFTAAGKRGMGFARRMIFNMRLQGKSIDQINEKLRDMFGPIARRRMLSIDNQMTKFRANLSILFKDVDLEGFLSGMDGVLSMFAKTTVFGWALRRLLGRMLNPFFDAIGGQSGVVTEFMNGMLAGALELENAWLSLRLAFINAFGADILGDLDATSAAVTAGKWAVLGLVAVVALGSAAFLMLGGVVATFLATILALPMALLVVGKTLISMISDAWDFWAGLDWSELGRAIVEGITEGLTTGSLANRVFDLAESLKTSFKSALGISSPSKVFEGFGQHITSGLNRGLDAGAPSVDDRISGLVAAPEVGRGGGVGGSSAVSITIGDVIVNAANTASAREIAVTLRDELADVLEGVSVEMGIA